MNAEKLALLKDEFRPQTPRITTSIFMLPAPVAVEFLRRCREQGLVLLGMDAFIIEPGVLQPTLDYSPDYSRSDLPYIPHDERYELAFKLLALPEVQHLYFESVIDRSDD